MRRIRFHRGGRQTGWPWTRFAFRVFGKHIEITISRQKPLYNEGGPVR